MTVRTTMSLLINRVRELACANLSETFYDVVYWTDEQLQDILDNYASQWDSPLTEGHFFYTYDLKKAWMIEPETVSVENASQEVVLDYLVDYNKKSVTFTTNPTTDVTIHALAYDIYQAVAEVWEIKASHRADYVDFKAGNHKIDMSQDYQHCKDRAMYYRNKKLRAWKR